jgi:hypothetical protein
MPVISALGRLRQEKSKFHNSLGYIARPCLEKNDIKNKPVTATVKELKEMPLKK